MKKILILQFIVCLLASSCSKDYASYTSDNLLEVSFSESVNTPFFTSQIIDTVMYVVLDSTCVVGRVDEVKMVDDYIYLVGKTVGAIQKFDKTGKYISSFNKKGHASDEYISMSDVDVSSSGDYHIYDAASSRIQRYTNEGVYKTSISINDFPNDFVALDNGDYLFYTPMYHDVSCHRGVWQTRGDGTFKRQLVSISEDFKYVGSIVPEYFCKINSNTYGLYGPLDSNLIFTITSDTIYASTQVNLDFDIPDEIKDKTVYDFESYIGSVYFNLSYSESSRWLLFIETDLKNSITCIFDKKENVLYQAREVGDFIDDVYIGCVDRWIEGKAIFLFDPHMVMSTQFLREKFPWVNDNSNPILAIGILRE